MDAVQQLARPSEAVLQRLRIDTRYVHAGAAADFDGEIVIAAAPAPAKTSSSPPCSSGRRSPMSVCGSAVPSPSPGRWQVDVAMAIEGLHIIAEAIDEHAERIAAETWHEPVPEIAMHRVHLNDLVWLQLCRGAVA